MANAEPSQEGFTAVAIDRDKNSQFAVRWAINNLTTVKNGIILVHVRTQQHLQPQDMVPKEGRAPTQSELQQFFLPYRGFCARKGVHAKEVVLHDLEVACALAEFINNNFITTIVLGASSRGAIARAFRNPDVPTSLGKSAPDFCTVYAIAKDRAQNVRSANRPLTPTGIFSSILPSSGGSLPDTPHSQDFNSPGSWKSASSEVSSLDGGSQITKLERSSDFMQLTQSERPGSKISSPQSSANSSKSRSPQNFLSNTSDPTQMTPRHRHPGSSSQSPQNSSDYMQLTAPTRLPGSQNYSPQHPVTVNDLLQMTPCDRPGSKISSPLHPFNNANLQIRTKGSPSHSTSGSSNPSGPPSFQSSNMSFEHLDPARLSEASRSSFSSQTAGEVEEELRRLRLELKQTMEMFNSACKEAMTANKKAREIDQWKSEEARKLEEAKQAQEAALAMVEMERQKCKVAVEAAQMAQRLAELEAQKRKSAEMRFQHEVEEKKKAMEALAQKDIRYRRYSIQEIETATDHFSSSEKIGEGGYGPVYKAYLDHTAVAIKVLRPDISQGQKQFNREIEVLSCMRHPHLVLLLGACPEYGCLVYEYMENGSLEDRLFRRNNTPSIPWSIRFKIAAEIATALHFLHQAKPEPLVHRDLKPANILLDRNYESKISDVGLARLVPASVADSVTQYCITAAAGTFCYIDPEYQQTGMLGTKSDLYSLGIILLQIITAKPPMGLTHHVEHAIENGEFAKILDPTVEDWPVEEALSFAKLALRCSELSRRDRPDLGSVIVPELERLRNLKSENGGISGASSSDQSFSESLTESKEARSKKQHF